MEPLPNPYKVRPDAETKRAPNGALWELERLAPRYQGTADDWLRIQYQAMLQSFVGEYSAAAAGFDSGARGSTVSTGDFAAYEPVDAVDAILREAQRRRVVMINEAHHVPRHRDFTTRLLQGLYDRGYRYLAAETFSPEVSALAQGGVPTLDFGYYSVEPVFGELVREALRLGYRLVPYEDESIGCSAPPEDPQFCSNQRDRIQAENLHSRVFDRDPRAKVLVHAGFDHIYKGPHPNSTGWRTMARVFQETYGIDPLCVDQVAMTERSLPAAEDAEYDPILERFNPEGPIILRALPAGTWRAPRERPLVDMQVIHPRAVYKHGRPDWLRRGRSMAAAPTDLCAEMLPCLLQAFYEGEDPASAVAADQVLVRTLAAAPALALKPGRYLFVALGPDAREVRRRTGVVE